VVRLAEDLEVLAERVPLDVQRRQRALALETQVADDAVIADDQHAHPAHRTPLHVRDQILRSGVVEGDGRRALHCSPYDLYRLLLEPLHPPPPPRMLFPNDLGLLPDGKCALVTPLHDPSSAKQRMPRSLREDACP